MSVNKCNYCGNQYTKSKKTGHLNQEIKSCNEHESLMIQEIKNQRNYYKLVLIEDFLEKFPNIKNCSTIKIPLLDGSIIDGSILRSTSETYSHYLRWNNVHNLWTIPVICTTILGETLRTILIKDLELSGISSDEILEINRILKNGFYQ